MVDQTRFTTVPFAYEVIRELIRSKDLQRPKDHFDLKLHVAIPRADTVEDGILTIQVDRIDLAAIERLVKYIHPNGDKVVETSARITSDGSPFKISVTLPAGRARTTKATVSVSPEMERIILDLLMRGFESELGVSLGRD